MCLLSRDRQKGPYTILLDIMNNIHSNIALTSEDELNGALPFLDLMITRPDVEKGCPYSLAVYRKQTHSDHYIHFTSSHPFTLKWNNLCCLLIRAYRVLRNHPRNLDVELQHLERAFTLPRNGYPRVVIRKWIKGFQRELEWNPAILDLPNHSKYLR